jgi:hypothetical protein
MGHLKKVALGSWVVGREVDELIFNLRFEPSPFLFMHIVARTI